MAANASRIRDTVHVLTSGSWNAKVADRISNMVSLGFVNNKEFIHSYADETECHVFPIAELVVNKSMLKELQHLVETQHRYFADFAKMAMETYIDSTDFL